MKKKFLGLFLLFALVAGFTACGGTGAVDGEDDDCLNNRDSSICKDRNDSGMNDSFREDTAGED